MIKFTFLCLPAAKADISMQQTHVDSILSSLLTHVKDLDCLGRGYFFCECAGYVICQFKIKSATGNHY